MTKPFDYKNLVICPQEALREVLLDKVCCKSSNGSYLVDYPNYYIFGELDTDTKFEGFSTYILKSVSPPYGYLNNGQHFNLIEVFRHENKTMLLEQIIKIQKGEGNG